MRRTNLLLSLAFLAVVWIAVAAETASGATSEKGTAMTVPDTSAKAPEFPRDLAWLNTAQPLRLADLRGKIVLLDFWTYCCINCMHVIPDLKRLEAKYPGELVVIGVHSAKFIEEEQTDNIRQAILRYDIRHPVVNDNLLQVWRLYGVRAWPTQVLIDPEGNIVGAESGEGHFDDFDKAIGDLIKTFDAKGLLDRKPLVLKPERERAAQSLLEFPGKVLADEVGGRLFIADSGHNRIVVAALADGTVTDVIGSGREGLKDGPPAEAQFNHPQGMALDGTNLYVADTENHAIRRVDLKGRTVTTIAGTGRQASRDNVAGPGLKTSLNSPWDLLVEKGSLYIAMAGSHQIWRMDLAGGDVAPYAGSGQEARLDGPLTAAALAQPSGITTDGKRLYFADSEDSSIRAADLQAKGEVKTIVGGDLFEFGDRDGKGLAVRLQHPLGVAWHDGLLYVADTYNNRIKVVNPEDQTCKILLGLHTPGLADGDEPAFYEPGGLSFAGGRLYIADTNNHVIRVADLATRRVQTLRLKNTVALATAPAEEFHGETVRLPARMVAPGQVTLEVAVTLPPGYKLTADAPTAVTVHSMAAAVLSVEGKDRKAFSAAAFPFRATLAAASGKTDVAVDLTLYYCDAVKDSVCLLKEVRLIVPVTVEAGAKGDRITATYTVPLPGK